VIGVAPPGFDIPLGAQIWAPLAYSDERWNDRRGTNLTVIGRLRDGVTIDQARTEMGAVAERLRRDFPETNGKRPFQIVDFITGMKDPGADRFLSVWQAAALFLLLIACANVANLLLARGAERSQEFAIRLALGAGRGRIVWQLLLEGVLLAVTAAAIALPLAAMALGLSRGSIPASVIRFVAGWEHIELTLPVFAFTAALAALATVIFATLPALHAARAGVAQTLRQTSRSVTSGRQRHWGRNLLATTQVALTLALLFASGLMLSASGRAIRGSLGFDERDLLTGKVTLPTQPYFGADQRRQFVATVLERMREIPAVSTASMVSNMPGGGNNASREFWPEGETLQPTDVRSVFYRRVSEDYFAAMRIPILAGRAFNTGDRPDSQPVAVVSRALVERYWPGQGGLGRRFRLTADGPLITVIGVAGDVRHDWFRDARTATVYRPYTQDAPFVLAFVVRTAANPMDLATELRRAVSAADPDQPVTEVTSMEQVLIDRAAGITFIARAVGVVSIIAVVLAITGLYSLMSFIAARRTQEFGVRLALGAGRWDVIRLTTKQAVGITAAGALLGGALSAGLGRLMESMLLGLVVNSFAQLGWIVLLLALAALVAAYLPAHRAASIDPTTALRAE
jgi:putative ABC transport system permease protein